MCVCLFVCLFVFCFVEGGSLFLIVRLGFEFF